MRAVVLRDFGGPEVLDLEEVPDPTPEAGEVVVKVHAVTVNRTLDLKVRENGTARGVTLPHVLGVDPAGVVVALSGDVRSVEMGARVAVLPHIRCGQCEFCTMGREELCPRSRHIGVHRWGGYAEYVSVPAKNLVPLPDELPFADAAVILRHAPTAFNLLRGLAGLRAGEWVLVMGATGGLGAAGMQVAKLLGATVIAGAGATARVDSALANGADHGVDYRTDDLAEEVERLTGGRGVDVVFENISDPALWPKAFASLAHSGRLVTAGAHGGGTVELDVRRLYGRRLRIIGGAGASKPDIASALDAAAQGKLRAVIDRIMPLHAAADAHRLFEKEVVLGKVVLDPTMARGDAG
ncbi:MAG: zinc-binding dehydrogenase [Propionibacteriales bacterium]|nr:zinc-binding dehydrogenase [Propionibacteriales bacterium]